MEKILFILGGQLEFSIFFGINPFYGDLKKLKDLLKKKRQETNEFTLILDVREVDQFPILEDNSFWKIFDNSGDKRLLIILHSYNKNIKNIIDEERTRFSIFGPLYYDFKLNDGTEITTIEDELIIYSIYNMQLDFYKELNGVLSMRMYLPDEVLKIPSVIEKKYKEKISMAGSISFPVVNISSEDLDLSSFTIKKLTYNPLDIDINKTTKLEISEKTIETAIADTFDKRSIKQIFDKISEVRNEKLPKIIKNFHSYITFEGAKEKLNNLSITLERVKDTISNLTKNIKKEINIINKVKKTAEVNIKELYKNIQNIINSELEDYHSQYKSIFKFIFVFKLNFVIIILLISILFSLFFFLLNISIHISISLPIILTLIIIILRWLKLKKKKKDEIIELCDESYSQIVREIDSEFKSIPSLIWDRNIALLNLKTNNIYVEYIKYSIEALKILTENSPQNLTDYIFSANNRLVSFIPTANEITDIQLDDINNCYMGLKKNELIKYFVEQYFKAFNSLRIGMFDKNAEEDIKNFCGAPDSGLLWKVDQVSDYRTKPVRKILVIPKEQNQNILDNVNIPIDEIKYFVPMQENNYKVIFLFSIFELKEE